jgi:hypothetical protein
LLKFIVKIAVPFALAAAFFCVLAWTSAHAAPRQRLHHRHWHRAHAHHWRRVPLPAPRPPVIGRDPPPLQGAIDALGHAGSDIIAAARPYLGQHNPMHFRVAWCAGFVNKILDRTGHRHNSGLRAIDKLRDGVRVASPRPGDLAVMRSHVTFFAGWGGRGFLGLGGNQGHARVTLASFPVYRVIAWIRVS